jgi:hypothetical protein
MLRVKGDRPRTYVHLPAEFSERCVVFFARVEPRDGDELDRSPMDDSRPELSAGLVDLRVAVARARPGKFAEQGGGQFVQRSSAAVVHDSPGDSRTRNLVAILSGTTFPHMEKWARGAHFLRKQPN